jgi:hypothetical protein
VHIDHFNLTTSNVFDASHRFRAETGLGFYDGGSIAGISCNFIFPLGDTTYIEIGGIVNAYAVEDPKKRPATWNMISQEERFMGLCFRADSMEEMQAISKRLNVKITQSPVMRVRPDGPPVYAPAVPTAGEAWPKGLPNWYCFEDRLYLHPSGQPVIPAPGLVKPLGLAWVEVGGMEAEMTNWLGEPASKYPFRFNGKTPGLYALGIKSDKGEIVVRRKPQTIP